MIGVVLMACIAAAPVKTLASPGLSCSNVDAKLVDSFLTHFNQQLTAQGGFQISTPAEVQALLGLDRQKALLGCNDESCSAEIAAALGVDAIITGNLTKTSAGYLINVKITRARGDTAALAVFTARPKTDEDVLDFLEGAAKKFSVSFGDTKDRGVVVDATTLTVPSASSGPVRIWPWVAAGGAAVSAGVGVAFVVLSQGTADTLRKGGANPAVSSDLMGLKSSGQTQELVGYTLIGVAGALAATSVALAVLGGSSNSAAVSVVATHQGGALVVGGSF